jgi:hypothetical protein
VQLVGGRLVEDVVDQRGLSGAADAGDRGEDPERQLDVDALEVVLRRPGDLHVAARHASLRRHLDPADAGEELARQRLGHRLDLGRRARRHDVAAVLAGPRAHVEQVVRRPHRALVVLHDEHGVAEVAQPLERGDQALVVALVQPDRRLVEDVEHADQRRADLRGEPDALRLAAAQRGRRALHREIAHAHVLEEAQPLVDLAQDQPRDRAVVIGELEGAEPLERPLRAQAGELVDRHVADGDGATLRPQP